MSIRIVGPLAVLVGVLPAFGGLVVVNSTQKLADAADLIVVGSLTTSHQNGEYAEVTIAVVRVLKGNSRLPSLDAETSFPQKASGPVPNSAAMTSIWFLKKDVTGVYKVLPAQEGDLDLQFRAVPVRADGPTQSYAYQANQSPIEKVALEIAASADQARGVGYYDWLVRSLQGINSPTVKRVFQAFSNSKEPLLRAAGLAGAIQNGDPQAVMQLEIDIQGALASVSGPASEEMQGISAAIELLYRNPDPAGLAALGRIGTNRSAPAQLQRAAAYALRAIHTKDTLQYLGQLLESPNQALRYEGVFGLASFANGLPMITQANIASMSYLTSNGNQEFSTVQTREHVPAFEEFQGDETKYLRFWKDWLRDNQFRLSM